MMTRGGTILGESLYSKQEEGAIQVAPPLPIFNTYDAIRRSNVKATGIVLTIRRRDTRKTHHKVRRTTPLRGGTILRGGITIPRGGQYIHNKG
jgi:hypothetical protein